MTTRRAYVTRIDGNLLPVVQPPADVRTVWGEVVDDAPPMIRIGPAAPTPPNVHEERTPRREPDFMPDVIVPALQAFGTGLFVLGWAPGCWHGRWGGRGGSQWRWAGWRGS